MIDFRSLAFFATVCRSESLVGAASEIGMSTSSLSTTISDLEQDLGIQLFKRINRTLYPTPEARDLMRLVDKLLLTEEFARRQLKPADDHSRAVLQLDLAFTFTIGGLSAAIREAAVMLASEYPQVLIDTIWTDGATPPYDQDVPDLWKPSERSRISIIGGQVDVEEDDETTILLSDWWVLASRFPAGTRRHSDILDLSSRPIVVPALSPSLLERVDRYLKANNLTNVQFVGRHPGELPYLLDEFPNAAVFFPQSLMDRHLGLANTSVSLPPQPFSTSIIARVQRPDEISKRFLKYLTQTLSRPSQRGFFGLPAITLRQLQYFNAVYQLRRVSVAARGLKVSQPAVSEQLKRLEQSLGNQMFTRQRDGVIPTAEGEQFAAPAVILERACRTLTGGHNNPAASQNRAIAIGILPSVNQYGFLVSNLAGAIRDLQQQYPEIKIAIQEATNAVLQDWVVRDVVDMAIVETSPPHIPRLPLSMQEDLVLVSHSRHQLTAADTVSFATMAKQKLLLPSLRSGLRQLIEQTAKQNGIRLIPFMEVDSLSMSVALLKELPVSTVLPPSAVRRELESGELVAQMITPACTKRFYLLYSGERTLSSPERRLLDILRQAMARNPFALQPLA